MIKNSYKRRCLFKLKENNKHYLLLKGKIPNIILNKVLYTLNLTGWENNPEKQLPEIYIKEQVPCFIINNGEVLTDEIKKLIKRFEIPLIDTKDDNFEYEVYKATIGVI